jgi:hypothetical protein
MGAYMASAMVKWPKRNGPLRPYFWRHSSQIATMRAMSAETCAVGSANGFEARTSIGIPSRSDGNPACISAETERASARALRSDGSSVETFSARYSQIASESQTTTSPSIRQGTLPDGEYLRISPLVALVRRGIRISSKCRPACFMASQGRRLHDE